MFVQSTDEYLGGNGYQDLTNEQDSPIYKVSMNSSYNNRKVTYYFNKLEEAKSCASYSSQPNLGGYSGVEITCISELPKGKTFNNCLDWI